jgi:hypothetical protein
MSKQILKHQACNGKVFIAQFALPYFKNLESIANKQKITSCVILVAKGPKFQPQNIGWG